MDYYEISPSHIEGTAIRSFQRQTCEKKIIPLDQYSVPCLDRNHIDEHLGFQKNVTPIFFPAMATKWITMFAS